ncbi:MAG: FeoA domain-containing protein [Bifidobacteriaceae bacterium]|nr:FeoA domain-containing protein [Bifidobacteriaceae bacterium]
MERLDDAVPAVHRAESPGRGAGLSGGAGFSGGTGLSGGTGPDGGEAGEVHTVRVVRLGESLQTNPDLLARFAAAEAGPGHTVAVVVDPGRGVWRLGGNGIVLELDREAAGHVFVTRDGTGMEG